MVRGAPAAVILAAGLGTRMGGNAPKPLTRVFGIPVIEHSLRELLRRGFRVVVVYHHEELKEHIRRHFPQVELVKNPHPERENGYSLLVAEERVKGNFFLLMGDHYFGDGFFRLLEERYQQNTAFVSQFCTNKDEATKVVVKEGLVVQCGKGIKEFNAFDTGLFFCTPEVFEEGKRLLEEGRTKLKLAEIFQSLASRGRLEARMVDEVWVDVDTPNDAKVAEGLIKRGLIKDSDGPVSRHLNRHISCLITKRFARYPWATPNAFTAISFALAVASALLFWAGCFALGGIAAQVASIVDGVDGEIARVKRMGTSHGGVLDSVSDRYADALIGLGMAMGYGACAYSLFGLWLFATGSILFSYTWHLTGVRAKYAGRDVRMLLVMAGGLLSAVEPFIVPATLIAVGTLAHAGSLASLYGFLQKSRNTTGTSTQ